ncbi:MAG: hypothetical protein Q8N03_05615 [Ignavibacteria bacterium]|jgi:hypothetical protein|nr:hypothetical protein [Ignavibacteria bacterium]
MLQKSLISFLLTLTFFVLGCDDSDYFSSRDYQAPAAPRGLEVLNGDDRADISWARNREGDLSGYNIYYSYEYDGEYELIGSTKSTYYVDYGARNGDKYYYAVTAFDYNGNESELSYEMVYAAPRPEGFNQAIFDYRSFPNNSGYYFSGYKVRPYDDLNTDFFFENYNGTFYLNVWSDSDILDLGPTSSIYDINYAPSGGWSSTKDEIAVEGHTYAFWTWDNHYAKIRIKTITNERIVFDWAYQMIAGERALKQHIQKERAPLKRNSNRIEIAK